MSWMKRRGPNNASPAPVPTVPMYNPNQHSNVQENQWQNQPVQNNWYPTQQPQFQQPVLKPEAVSQPQQNYWQQPYSAAPYNQNNQQYGQSQQYAAYAQNNTGYGQQNYSNLHYSQLNNQNNVYGAQTGQQQSEGDAWNWGWGDEDNSNVQLTAQSSTNSTNQVGQIENAFATDESWNWGVEDSKNPPVSTEDDPTDSQQHFPKVTSNSKSSLKSAPDTDPSKLNPVQDHLTVSGKRGKLETPQWSTESQMSQESSDDILHTSESDKSHMMSRSSTISHSPISGLDLVPQQHLEEIPVKNESYENKEILSNLRVNPTPPPPSSKSMPPSMTPPSSLDDSKNPYKRTTGLSHTSANRFRTSNITPPDTRQPIYQPSFHNQQVNLETPPDNAEQPDPISTKSMQKVKSTSQRPDNNEAPINDRNQYLETGHLSEGNYNETMEDAGNTRQDLRSSSYDLQESGEGTSDALPPPGLRRMVPGQLEQNENGGNPVNFTDEPPPGLSRMVLGQTEASAPTQLGVVTQNKDMSQFDVSGPPEGLHRMVPGESSSPESSVRQQQQNREENDSEPEFNQLSQHTSQPRSATIGADTPPAVANANQATTNISYTRLENGTTNSQSRGSSNEPDSKRRDSIEGEPQETEMSKITNSVRNMTVGENLTDGHTSNNSLPDQPQRRHSRQESSDSERESRKPPRGPPRDKRSSERTRRDRDKEKEKERDKSRRERDRYSPDSYRDKKYERRRYRDRRYEEDTDYYSDKEKDRRNYEERDREYERKYSSLRKDKDKDRPRRDPREPRDYRSRDYYYGSRYEDFENDQRSRPSSRSDSMHDSYRVSRGLEKDDRDRRNREKDKYRSRRDNRDAYNPYQGYSYDPYNPYYQQYQYYENLRRTNPQAYAEWYRKYYQQAAAQTPSYGGEDRASVHSGRSSANDELAKDRYTRQSFYSQMSASHLSGYYRESHAHSVTGGHYTLDASSYSRPFDQTDSSLNLEDTTLASQRLTPAKFATAHIKASIASGKLLRILPHYPMDGQPATVEICNTHSFLANDEEFKELSQFPGPLVKGITHKKTIIEYCENKIRDAFSDHTVTDVESYILMWELLILLIRQNGMVVGADIAELLLKNSREVVPLLRPSSVVSSISSNNGDANPLSEASNNVISDTGSLQQSILKEEEITNKFREFLLYGSGKEALEWAMKHSLWGHALFLASKLDKRTYANVMMRFANGLTMNDPLQTLYQLLSGKMPAAVTCVSDEKWGDWRPHLAMILSNSSQRPELNCKAITTLGDTLRHRGNLYAAQFCYLMAEVGFGKYNDPETRLVLLGADHSSKPYYSFATNEAIHMTEIYEFACGLNDPAFVIPHFQVYKYLLATRLVDRGLVEKSLAYLEKISTFIVANPTLVEASFVDNVYNLADRLKFYDLVGEVEDESEFGGILETSRPDNSWLKDLKTIQNDFHAGLISHQSIQNLQTYVTSLETDHVLQPAAYETNSGHDAWQQQYDDQQYQPNAQQQQQPWQSEQPQHTLHTDYQDSQQLQQQSDFPQNQYQEQQHNYWPNYHQINDQVNQYNQENVDHQNFYSSNAQLEDTSQPQTSSLPNQPNSYDGENHPGKKEEAPSNAVKPKASAEPEKTQSTGWFGGIFSKLALKPKNQMKLPDDKNPKIVWDEAKKRWSNLDNDTDDPTNEFKPPPKLSDLMPKLAQSQPQDQSHSTPNSNNSLPAFDPNRTLTSNGGMPTGNPAATAVDDSGNGTLRPAPAGNMFKLQKGRNLKNSYIDVFNPGAKTANSGPSSLPALSQMPSSGPQMNFFIPQPIADPNAPVDFLTPGGVPYMGDQQQQ